jgi:predicted membrane metal-binding protein
MANSGAHHRTTIREPPASILWAAIVLGGAVICLLFYRDFAVFTFVLFLLGFFLYDLARGRRLIIIDPDRQIIELWSKRPWDTRLEQTIRFKDIRTCEIERKSDIDGDPLYAPILIEHNDRRYKLLKAGNYKEGFAQSIMTKVAVEGVVDGTLTTKAHGSEPVNAARASRSFDAWSASGR